MIMTEKDKEVIVRCTCGDRTDHVIMIGQYDMGEEHGDDKLGQCLVSLTLDVRLGWFDRVKAALKYVFGRQNYMYMDTMVDVDILKEVVLELKDTRTEEEKDKARENRAHNVKVV